MTHLILTGLMGSGKTTVGKILAQELSLPFVDLDEKITEQTGLIPKFYLPRFGEAAFRRIETICLKRVLAEPVCVLATGGGVVLNPINRRQMLVRGLVIWLDPPLALIRQRLKITKDRPLLTSSPDPIKTLYQQRLPCYRFCHERILETGPPKAIAISILRRYKLSECTPSC